MVIADGVDGETGALGELVDPPVGLGHLASVIAQPSSLPVPTLTVITLQCCYTRSHNSWCRRKQRIGE